MRRTTLVLGAGSSHFLGYPVGSQLRLEILNLTQSNQLEFSISSGLMKDHNELYGFIDEFRKSQFYSIDAFLGRRPEFTDIGKRAIAAIILRAESLHQILHVEHEDHWYRYLLNRLYNLSAPEDDANPLSIITFNYDRSLEHYLFQAIQAVFRIDSPSAAKKSREIPIVHVYGSLGSPIPHDSNFLPYGSAVSIDTVAKGAKSIVVIPEGRDDSEGLVIAREMLSSADQIAFLGFGFDQLNMSRLNSAETCKDMQQRQNGSTLRTVSATCLGLTKAEAMNAHAKLGQIINTQRQPTGLPSGFWDCGCLRLLRETELLA